jgi:Flp pilus assembly protein TadG
MTAGRPHHSARSNDFGRLRTNVSGSSAVEFAILTPLFFLFLGGVFDGALVFHSKQTIELYAREAARGVAIGYMTEAQATTFATTKCNGAISPIVTVAIDPPTPGNAADRDAVVTISITKLELKKASPFGVFLPDGLTSAVTMRSVLP